MIQTKVLLKTILSSKSAFSINEKVLSFFKKNDDKISLYDIYKEDGEYFVHKIEDASIEKAGKSAKNIEDIYMNGTNYSRLENKITLEEIEKIIGMKVSEKLEADIIDSCELFEEIDSFILRKDIKFKAVCY